MSQFCVPYPKPGPVGGVLIRKVIAFLRQHDVQLPISSDILIAFSGGVDSMALAHLMIHFGRRIGDRSRIHLLHINHRWRGAYSDADEQFGREWSEKWGVPWICHSLVSPEGTKGVSWENEARWARKRIFQEEAQKRGALVMTAHQGDDLAETLLWRLFTGSSQTHGAGIVVSDPPLLRPFLSVRKQVLSAYLQEVGQVYRDDSTNHSERFLRARMRQQLIPVVESLFPRAVEHLIQGALRVQLTGGGAGLARQSSEAPGSFEFMEGLQQSLFGMEGLRIRRSHWEAFQKMALAKQGGSHEIYLPEGWRLRKEALPEKPRVRTEMWDSSN